MIRNHDWIFFQGFERDLHSLFKLRVVSRRNGSRIVFDFDVWSDAVIFYFPLTV